MFNVGDTVIHSKTGNFYKILAIAENAENGNEGQQVVVYKNFQGKVFTRPYSEFVELVHQPGQPLESEALVPRFRKVNFSGG